MISLPPKTEVFYTLDGSPTLCFERGDGYREKMHHSGGALSESLYIYYGALRAALDAGFAPAVLSVGLGLAYNEMLTQAELLRREDWRLWSFEPVEALREGFRAWIYGEDRGELADVLACVCAQTSASFAITPEMLRAGLRSSLDCGRLELRGAFPEAAGGTLANVVYYDAYSRKMDEELWAEQMLTRTFSELLQPDCVLATYARTGNLNRSLRQLGFRASGKIGFAGKRESTMAFRGHIGEANLSMEIR